MIKKEDLKMRKTQKTIEKIGICKLHGGPVTTTSLHLLEQLTEKLLLAEVSYLRLTIMPEIRQMRQVKTSNRQYRVEKFRSEELKASMKNVLKPESHITMTVNSLLGGIV